MSDAINEIKARLPIENLVAEYVTLKRVGKSLKGLCPFHSEKTPSFIVSPDKCIAYCFGCQKGGDIFRFLMEIENIDFSEALKILAEKTGVTLEKNFKKDFVKKSEKDLLFEINEYAAAFYEKELWSERGEFAIKYLRERGLSDETIRLFRLGFSPDSFDATHRMLLNKGYKPDKILLSGLALAKDTSMLRIYDRFRGRIMFPVTDSLGRVSGFGGRALQSEQQPKYLNSPETPIYKKNQLFYGFNYSKPAIKANKQAIIVEGYMDYLMAFQDGVKNVLAVNGTALTKRHLIQLKPYIDELVLSFDMDNAGQEAARRSFELTQDFDFIVKVMILPFEKDIADFVLKNPGKLKNLFSDIRIFADYFYENLFIRFDKNSPLGKRKILSEFAQMVSKIRSSVERDGYVRKLALDLEVPEVQIYDELNIMKLTANHPAKQIFENEKKQQQHYSPDEILLGLILNYPSRFYAIKDCFMQDDLPESIKTIYNRFLSNYNPQRTDQENVLSIFSDLDEGFKSRAVLLSLFVEEKYGDLSDDTIEKEIVNLIQKIRRNQLDDLRHDLQNRLKNAEVRHDQKEIQEILMTLSDMTAKNSKNT